MIAAVIQRGPVIGFYMDEPIHEWMQWGADRLYYKGIASVNHRGMINLQRLEDNEHLVVPGLIYAPHHAIPPRIRTTA